MTSLNKTLLVENGTDFNSIIEKITEIPEYDEPFFVCDVENLIYKVEYWRKLLPRVDIFYATKCNESLVVLETFAALGLGFDCASKEEIRKILALGIPPEKIIFSNPTKLIDHILYANEKGVKVMTFDNQQELIKIKEHYPTAELLMRIRCDDPLAKYKLGKKFGIPPENANGILETAKKLNLNIIGIHFHVGSGCESYETYYTAIATAKSMFKLAESHGFKFKMLDIGGGYPGESSKPIDEIAYYINKGLDEFFSDDDVRIVAEPGKYCCNTAFKLVTQIHSRKIVKDENDDDIRMYYVDVGVYNGLICVLFNEYYMVRPVREDKSKEKLPCIIWGPTMDSDDRISEKYDFLPDLKYGDWILFEEAGGYTLSITCEYSGFCMPRLCSIINKSDWKLLTGNGDNPVPEDRFTTSFDQFAEVFKEPYQFRTHYS